MPRFDLSNTSKHSWESRGESRKVEKWKCKNNCFLKVISIQPMSNHASAMRLQRNIDQKHGDGSCDDSNLHRSNNSIKVMPNNVSFSA